MKKDTDNNDDFSPDEFVSLGKNLDSDQPEFDLVFQQGLLNMALREDHFCMQLVRYLGGKDKDLKNFQIFDNIPTERIFEMITKSVEKTASRPSEGELRQLFTEYPPDEREHLNIALDSILALSINNDAFYRTYIGSFVQRIKFLKGMVKIQNSWKKEGGLGAPDVMQEVLDSIRRVDFEQQNIVRLSDFDSLFSERKNSTTTKIPTGITQLDEDLLGGLPRESLVVVLAGTNVGKSIFCTSLGVQALKSKDERGKYRGFKVLHINLEGRHDESLFRYLANLAQVSYKSIATGNMSEAETARVRQAQKEIGDRLLIRNMTGFGVTIEDLVAYTREVYKDFKFDMLVCDYGQLLESRAKSLEARHTMARVFRGLDSMSKEFKAVVISPAQGTRSAQENQNGNKFASRGRGGAPEASPVMRSADISEAFEIARVSAVILTLNRTDEEGEQGKLRVFLEKQREGAKNKTYGIFANYPMMDVITGRYYDPRATMTKENEAVKDTETMTLGNFDPDINETDQAESKKTEIDSLVELYKELNKQENDKKVDYNDERKKEHKNNDILAQYAKDLDDIKKKKLDIAKKSQEAIKIVDPNASASGLKDMEASLRDLMKSNAPEKQINDLEQVVNRYRLALKGKL